MTESKQVVQDSDFPHLTGRLLGCSGCSCIFSGAILMPLFPSFIWKSEAASASALTSACGAVYCNCNPLLCLSIGTIPPRSRCSMKEQSWVPATLVNCTHLIASHFIIWWNTEDIYWKEGCCCYILRLMITATVCSITFLWTGKSIRLFCFVT